MDIWIYWIYSIYIQYTLTPSLVFVSYTLGYFSVQTANTSKLPSLRYQLVNSLIRSPFIEPVREHITMLTHPCSST